MARFAECLVLAIAGGIAGVAFAVAGVRLFIALVPANVPRLNEVHLSLPVLLFAAIYDCDGILFRYSACAPLTAR